MEQKLCSQANRRHGNASKIPLVLLAFAIDAPKRVIKRQKKIKLSILRAQSEKLSCERGGGGGGERLANKGRNGCAGPSIRYFMGQFLLGH